MVIDMHAEGVEVRPLKMATGGSEFNEVFFNDVFVPDDDVVGPVDGGWTVARATLGNESVSIGGGSGGGDRRRRLDGDRARSTPTPSASPAARRASAATSPSNQAMALLNLRSAHRAVAGGGPGPEGSDHQAGAVGDRPRDAAILSELAGPDTAFLDGKGGIAGGCSC